jgi:hypothetical protein
LVITETELRLMAAPAGLAAQVAFAGATAIMAAIVPLDVFICFLSLVVSWAISSRTAPTQS